MCLAFYLGTDGIVKTIPWDKKKPALYIKKASVKEVKLLKYLQGYNVYYIGSHEGCGCGFSREGREEKELIKIDASRNDLAKLIKNLLSDKNTVKLYICWEGEQGDEPKETKQMELDEFLKLDYDMGTRSLLTITI